MRSETRSFNASMTRRGFLKTSAGVVAVSILPVRAFRAAEPSQWAAPSSPGVAKQRIDGLAKVTGQKIYARDFNARDFTSDATGGKHDWPGTQWYALFLRATTTVRKFQGLDLSLLGDDLQPSRIVFGDDLTAAQRSPKIGLRRDLHVDAQIAAAQADPNFDQNFDRPGGLQFDLIVQRGQLPDFLGQAVALLLFDRVSTYRAAKRLLQFQDEQSQVYSRETYPNPNKGEVFDPVTDYVKMPSGGIGGLPFARATVPSKTYDAQFPGKRQEIEDRLNSDPDLLRQPFKASMQAMDPMFMEPESGLAWLNETDPSAKRLELVIGTQSPDGDVGDIAEMYSDKTSDAPDVVSEVILHSCFPGGGFGGRDSSPLSLMLALCAGFTGGMPVKLEYDRFEQFRVGLKRHACEISGLLAAQPDMTLDTIQMKLGFDAGGRKNLSPYVAALGALCAGGSYVIPRADIHATATHSQNISGGSQRGFGGPQAYFAIETGLDDLAHAQGWDPIALRRKNLLVSDSRTVAGGQINQSLRLEEMLDFAEAHPIWAERAALKAQWEKAQTDSLYGTGIAMSIQAYGTSGDGVIAGLSMDADGTLHLRTDAVDMGNGSATTLAVVVADALGANADQVHAGDYTLWPALEMEHGWSVANPDWSNPNWSAKSVGSSSACLTGLHQIHVVQQTARAFFDGVIAVAVADMTGMSPDEVRRTAAWRNGVLVLSDGSELSRADIAGFIHDQSLPNDIICHAYYQAKWVSSYFQTPTGALFYALDAFAVRAPGQSGYQRYLRVVTQEPPKGASARSRYVWAPCVNVIGLSVDTASGQVTVQNSLSVLNAGKVFVRPLVEGMSQGGIGMMVGWTLLEDMPPGLDGPANGDWNLNRYHVPRYGDLPKSTQWVAAQRNQILHILDPGDETEGRGIAEAVMCSVAPAISNALRDATGHRFTSLPITPDKIREALS